MVKLLIVSLLLSVNLYANSLHERMKICNGKSAKVNDSMAKINEATLLGNDTKALYVIFKKNVASFKEDCADSRLGQFTYSSYLNFDGVYQLNQATK